MAMAFTDADSSAAEAVGTALMTLGMFASTRVQMADVAPYRPSEAQEAEEDQPEDEEQVKVEEGVGQVDQDARSGLHEREPKPIWAEHGLKTRSQRSRSISSAQLRLQRSQRSARLGTAGPRTNPL